MPKVGASSYLTWDTRHPLSIQWRVTVKLRQVTMESSTKINRLHVVAMPYPGRGHINPMMNFCKLLITKFLVKDDIRVTFVVTEEWLGLLESESRLPPQIQLHSIPNVIPSELGRGLDHSGFSEAVRTKMEDPFEQFLDKLQQKDDPGVGVTAIIADTILAWAVSVGSRRSIPVVSLWPLSPTVFSIVYHIDLLKQNGHYPVDFSSDELIDYIPGVSPIRLADMPASLDLSRKRSFTIAENVSAAPKAHCLLLTTYYELEPRVTKALMEILPVPVYAIGPSIPLPTTLRDDHDRRNIISNVDTDEYYLKWLDAQPERSVLYVSFGSLLSASSEQMEEILAGLFESGVIYLLVSPGGKESINDNEMDKSRSLVVPWCNQLRVLCHSSVGGFWTHCGWNSILEGVYAGVPMLTSPVGLDQFTSRALVVDCWKIGMNIIKEVGAEISVKREEVALTVKNFMNSNGDNEESKLMMTRANELKKSCRQALAKGGSSTANLDDFIRNILRN
ncbi:UDP-glycosyltransferase 87A2-like [Papaver somniferum]|uniref:UDP-glycosyltransferase 87A2-like n=1 Tax=Papaver somniferum TaxID=3469 RepID=UPI000E6F7001|nr:UDP-glycosyltransferase 87A2-like [Papaver somniferum]